MGSYLGISPTGIESASPIVKRDLMSIGKRPNVCVLTESIMFIRT